MRASRFPNTFSSLHLWFSLKVESLSQDHAYHVSDDTSVRTFYDIPILAIFAIFSLIFMFFRYFYRFLALFIFSFIWPLKTTRKALFKDYLLKTLDWVPYYSMYLMKPLRYYVSNHKLLRRNPPRFSLLNPLVFSYWTGGILKNSDFWKF